MRPLLALALLALLCATLAGCADDPERFPDGQSGATTSRSTSTSTPPATSSSGPTTTGAPSNQPPTGSISVAINGTNATFTLTGVDPDGDDLAWDLDFGDGNMTNGTQLPAVLNHTYAAGNFTANFTLSDGVQQAAYNATFAVASASSAPVQLVSGEVPVSNGNCLGATSSAPAAAFFPAESDGITYIGFAVDPATLGKPFLASFTGLASPFGSIGALVFTDPDGAYLMRLLTSADGQSPEAMTGTVPDTAANGYIFGCLNEPDPVGVSYAA
jgi:hypothetical protein